MMEDEPIRSTPRLDLEALSESDLEERIEGLQAEIEACRKALEKKRAHRSAADAFFKS